MNVFLLFEASNMSIANILWEVLFLPDSVALENVVWKPQVLFVSFLIQSFYCIWYCWFEQDPCTPTVCLVFWDLCMMYLDSAVRVHRIRGCVILTVEVARVQPMRLCSATWCSFLLPGHGWLVFYFAPSVLLCAPFPSSTLPRPGSRRSLGTGSGAMRLAAVLLVCAGAVRIDVRGGGAFLSGIQSHEHRFRNIGFNVNIYSSPREIDYNLLYTDFSRYVGSVY